MEFEKVEKEHILLGIKDFEEKEAPDKMKRFVKLLDEGIAG
jgi:hypothetical protein